MCLPSMMLDALGSISTLTTTLGVIIPIWDNGMEA